MSRPPVYGRNNRDTDQYMLTFSKKALGLNLLACSPCVCMGSLVTTLLQISRAMSLSVYSADGFFHFLYLAQKKCPDNHADNWWMELSRQRNTSIVCKLRKPEKDFLMKMLENKECLWKKKKTLHRVDVLKCSCEMCLTKLQKYKQREVAGAARFIFKKRRLSQKELNDWIKAEMLAAVLELHMLWSTSLRYKKALSHVGIIDKPYGKCFAWLISTKWILFCMRQIWQVTLKY